MTAVALCHPDRTHAAHGLCHRCYDQRWRNGEYGARAIRGPRPLIDLDLGHACQYGYHQPPVRVFTGPPILARLAAAAAEVLADGTARTTVELGIELGLTADERQRRLTRALAQMADAGNVHRLPRNGKSTIWRLAA